MLCDTLRTLRRKKGLERKQIAAQLGVSLTVYSNWETGRSLIPAEYIRPICKTLNVSADRFINFEYQSDEGYFRNFKSAEGLINYAERDDKNRRFVLWLANDFDGDFDGLVLMSTAYACMTPKTRTHILVLIWDAFESEYSRKKTQMPQIAKSVYSLAPEYARKLRELDEKGR